MAGGTSLASALVLVLPGLTSRRGGAFGLAAVDACSEVTLDMGFTVPRSPESEFTEGAFEGLGAGVEAHVNLQTALCGEGGVAHVAAEQFLPCRDK